MDKEFEYSVTPLFAIPVFNTMVEPISDGLKNFVFNLEYERMFVGNGYYSTDKYVLHRPECKPLYEAIMFRLNLFTHDFLHTTPDIHFEMTNSWVVKHERGDWGQAHVHTNCLLSGVVYLQTDDKSGKIVFRKETGYNNLFPNGVDVDFTTWNIFNARSWSFQPHDNELFIFPSTLLHSVDRNDSDTERYSLAFNFFPRGKFGTKEFELIL